MENVEGGIITSIDNSALQPQKQCSLQIVKLLERKNMKTVEAILHLVVVRQPRNVA